MVRLFIAFLCTVCAFIFGALSGMAQSLSGTWQGNFPPNSFFNDTRKLIVVLKDDGQGNLTGTSRLEYDKGHYEYYRIVGTYNAQTGQLKIREYLAIAVNLPEKVYNRMGTYTLQLSTTSKEERFDGEWRDNDETDFRAIKPAQVFFLRYKPSQEQNTALPPAAKPAPPLDETNDTATTAPLPATDNKQVAPTLKPLSRMADIQSKVPISAAEKDSIKIEVFDNGEIDGDIVSIYLDNKLLVARYNITHTPLVFYLTLSNKAPIKKIKMIAESMGENPPCTAYLRITTKKKELGISLSSEWNKNGVVQFYLKQ